MKCTCFIIWKCYEFSRFKMTHKIHRFKLTYECEVHKSSLIEITIIDVCIILHGLSSTTSRHHTDSRSLDFAGFKRKQFLITRCCIPNYSFGKWFLCTWPVVFFRQHTLGISLPSEGLGTRLPGCKHGTRAALTTGRQCWFRICSFHTHRLDTVAVDVLIMHWEEQLQCNCLS